MFMFPFKLWKNHSHALILNVGVISKEGKGWTWMDPVQKKKPKLSFGGKCQHLDVFPILPLFRNPKFLLPSSFSGSSSSHKGKGSRRSVCEQGTQAVVVKAALGFSLPLLEDVELPQRFSSLGSAGLGDSSSSEPEISQARNSL